MIYTHIPDIDIPIPAITFGGASLSGEGGGYGFGSMNEDQAQKVLQKAWECGITLFDTAPIYGFGLSEERLGKYLPKEAKIISKSGVDWHDTKRVNMTNDPVVTEKMLHQSLKRLNREQIDFYMIHWPDARVDIREPLQVLVKAQKAGKIQFIGLCNTNLDDLKKAQEICPITVIQSEHNLFNQEPFLKLNNTWKDKLSMSWGTFDKGILSGRVTQDRKFSPEDCRSWAPWWNKKEVLDKIKRTADLKTILDEYQISLADFCLHANLNYFGLSTCLIGLKSEEDVVQMTCTLQKKLMRERIEEVLKRWN